MRSTRTRIRVGSAARRSRPATAPAVDSTGRRLRLGLQLALLIGALVAIVLYGGALGERAAGCFGELGSGEPKGSATARFPANDAGPTRDAPR